MEATRPVGRPTAYQPEYCERVIALGKAGKSKAQIACELDVTRQTIENWIAEYPEFFDAMDSARMYAQAWFENIAQNNMTDPVQGFSASLWAKQVSCRFPDDYTDRNKTEITAKVTHESWLESLK